VLQLAGRGIARAAQELPPIAAAVNIMENEVTNKAVAETFGMRYHARF
jgi:alanine dehydrogenase